MNEPAQIRDIALPSPHDAGAMTVVSDPKSQPIFRSLLSDSDRLELRVSDGSGMAMKGDVIELSNTSVNAQFARKRSPIFAIGEETQLQFCWFHKNVESQKVLTQVSSRIDTKDSLRYLFTFLELPGQGYIKISNLFNRRVGYRARPRSGEKIELRLWEYKTGPRESLLVTEMIDISVGGIGMIAPVHDDEILRDHTMIYISFQLPGTSEPRTVTARIISRTLQGNIVRYGLEFSEKLTPHWALVLKMITAFVDKRKYEELGRMALGAPARD